MAQQFTKTPSFNEPLSIRGVTSRNWYFFWDALWRGLAPGEVLPLTLTGSPFTYSPSIKGSVIISGGTVSLVRFSRDGTTFYNVGATAGMFFLNAADRIEVTYSSAPVMTFVPS